MDSLLPNFDTSSTTSAGATVLSELLVPILIHLPYFDLLHCRATCSLWKRCIDEERVLRQHTWKAALPIRAGEDPHFEKVSELATNLKFTQGEEDEWLGQGILKKSQDARMQLLSSGSTVDGGQPEDTKVRDGDGWLKNSDDDSFRPKLTEYFIEMYLSRSYVRGIRFPNGWPAGYKEIYCEICRRFHVPFRFETLHPALQFMEPCGICFTGAGGRLIVEFHTFLDKWAPGSCYEDYGRDLLTVGRGLRRAMDNVHLHDQLFSNPPVTLIIQKDKIYRSVANVNGITLKEALPLLLLAFVIHVRGAVWSAVHDSRCSVKDRRRINDSKQDFRIAYPEDAAWVKKHEEAPEILNKFMDDVAELNRIFEGVSAWAISVQKDGEGRVTSMSTEKE